MTVRNAPDGPLWLQGLGTRQNNAASMRRFLASLFQKAGVLHTGDLAVTASGSPDYHVNVAAGYALVAGTQATDQGLYFDYNDASVQLTIQPANPSLPRLDRVVLVNPDQAYSGVTDDAFLQVVLGTAASSPLLPAAPANSLDLAQVSVPANAPNIPQGNITDLRQFASLLGSAWRYKARMYSSAGFTLPIGGGLANWNTKDFDPNNNLTLGAGASYTVPVTGFYFVSSLIEFNTSGASALALTLCINGADNVEGRNDVSGAAVMSPSVSTILFLTAGQVLTVNCFQNSGATMNTSGGAGKNYFAIHYLSPQV